MKNVVLVPLGFIAGALFSTLIFSLFLAPKQNIPPHLMPYQTNITKVTTENTDFRHVLFTGATSQLVVMSIPPGSEVGQETHKDVEQALFFQTGTGEAILDGKTTPIVAGDMVIVTPGTQHNFKNTGTVVMKIMTIYAPPNHIDGRIQHTKLEADADVADEAFGNAQ